jgi:hypothetical protein
MVFGKVYIYYIVSMGGGRGDGCDYLNRRTTPEDIYYRLRHRQARSLFIQLEYGWIARLTSEAYAFDVGVRSCRYRSLLCACAAACKGFYAHVWQPFAGLCYLVSDNTYLFIFIYTCVCGYAKVYARPQSSRLGSDGRIKTVKGILLGLVVLLVPARRRGSIGPERHTIILWYIRNTHNIWA